MLKASATQFTTYCNGSDNSTCIETEERAFVHVLKMLEWKQLNENEPVICACTTVTLSLEVNGKGAVYELPKARKDRKLSLPEYIIVVPPFIENSPDVSTLSLCTKRRRHQLCITARSILLHEAYPLFCNDVFNSVFV